MFFASKKFLTLSALLLIAVYHGYAGVRLKLRSPLWQTKRLEAKLGSQLLFSVPNLAFSKENEKLENIDSSILAVAKSGHFLKYKLGETPEWIFSGVQDPYAWFFLREELLYSHPISIPWVNVGYRKQIDYVVNQAEKLGILVIPVPVPSKLSIYRNKAPKNFPAESLWGPERMKPELTELDPWIVYKQALGGKNTVDLYTIFKNQRHLSATDFLYVPGDTHWSSRAISLAAIEVIKKIKKIHSPSLIVPKLVNVEKRLSLEEPDLYRAMQVPVEYSRRWQWREPLYELERTSTRALLGTGRLIMAGSSFSTRLQGQGLNLGKILSRSLNIPVHDFSVTGGSGNGAFQAMKNKKFKLQRGDILIWEFPIRTPFKKDEMPEAFWI